MTAAQEVSIRLRVICFDPPLAQLDGRATQFGLQDKNGKLNTGQLLGNGSRMFECEVRAKPTADGVNILGEFTHGTPAARFLYLSLRYVDEPNVDWIKRIKVPLTSIRWPQIEGLDSTTQVLEASVDGQRAATVELLSAWMPAQR